MGNIINTAPCRFCGQMVQIDSEEKLTQPQAEEQATMSCTCEQAVEYQKEKQRKEKAMQNVAALFGEAAAPEKRCSEGIVNILKAAVEEIYTGGLAKVTLNLRGGVKASISQNSKGEINIERNRDQKAEINRIGERVRVTEREICGSFRRAENQKQQIQILTELTCKSEYQISVYCCGMARKYRKALKTSYSRDWMHSTHRFSSVKWNTKNRDRIDGRKQEERRWQQDSASWTH